MGPPQLCQSVCASIALFGNLKGPDPEVDALYENLWEQYYLLLRCLRNSICLQIDGMPTRLVRIMKADSKAFLHSSEITGLMNRFSLRNLAPPEAVILLYYRCCLLLISYLESDTLLSGILSDNSSILAFSVVETCQELCRAESPIARAFDLWVIFQMLPLSGLALTPDFFPHGTIHCPKNVLILVETQWIIEELEKSGASHEARLLEGFWATRDIEFIATEVLLCRFWDGVILSIKDSK